MKCNTPIKKVLVSNNNKYTNILQTKTYLSKLFIFLRSATPGLLRFRPYEQSFSLKQQGLLKTMTRQQREEQQMH